MTRVLLGGPRTPGSGFHWTKGQRPSRPDRTSGGADLATTGISGDFPASPVLLGLVLGFDEEGRIDRPVIAP